MEKKTCSPKGSSSSYVSRNRPASSSSSSCTSSVSRNPPATYDELLQRFQTLWSNTTETAGSSSSNSGSGVFCCNAAADGGGVSILSSPKIETGCLSYSRDLGKQIHGAQEHGFTFMGSSSSSNPTTVEYELQRYIASMKNNNRPTTTYSQLLASHGLVNGGAVLNSYNDLAGNYSSSMNHGLHRAPVDSVSRFNRHAVNHLTSNGYTSEDQASPPGYLSTSSSSIDDEDFDARNLRNRLIESKGWPVEKVLKICSDDPSLLDEIKPDDIVTVAEIKLGSLYLQRILKDQNPLYFNKIFDATLDSMFHLMTNSEGTYVIRKLHSLCDSRHMSQIVGKIMLQRDHLKNAARNEFGSDTLMKLIRVLKSTNPLFLKYVLDALTSEMCIISMMKSKPGNNLFRCCLKYLDSRQNQVLHNRVATHCFELATDDSGYVSLIALIETTPNPYKEELLFKISDKAVYLSQDPKGNYVIQAILTLRIPEIELMICRNLVGSYLCLSIHKCASNVIERCIMSSGMEYPVLELICSNKLHLLSQDPMGNYVVQRALNATQQLKRLDLYDSLVGEIQPYLKDLQYHPIGRNVFRLINKRKVIMSKFVY